MSVSTNISVGRIYRYRHDQIGPTLDTKVGTLVLYIFQKWDCSSKTDMTRCQNELVLRRRKTKFLTILKGHVQNISTK